MSYRVQTFQAPSMREALERVKRELGPEAVILGTRTLPTTGLGILAGRRRVEIAAAPADLNTPAPRVRRAVAAPPTPTGPEARPWPEDLEPYYVELVQNEVAEEIAAQLVRQATERVPRDAADRQAAIREALRTYIAEVLPGTGGVDLRDGRVRRIAFVGPSGGGKTTTLAKLAAHFQLRHGARVILLSLDMQRMGAHEQLRRYAEVIGVPMHTAQTIAEVKSCLAGLVPTDLLLIDTMGVGVHEHGRFARLAALLRAARPDETHLVLPAALTAGAQRRIVESFAPLGIQKLVLSRLDEAIGFGVVLNVTQRLHMPVSYVTTGQGVPNDIEEACGPRVAQLLLG